MLAGWPAVEVEGSTEPEAGKSAFVRGSLLVVAGATLWGHHGAVVQIAYGMGFTVPQVLFGEFLLGTVFLGAWSLFRGEIPRGMGAAAWAEFLLFGLCGGSVGLLLFIAFSLGPVPVATTLLFLYLPLVFLVSLVFLHEKASPLRLAAVAIILLGAVGGTNLPSVGWGDDSLAGAPAAFGAACAFAGLILWTPRLSGRTTAVFRALLCCVGPLLVFLPVALAQGWALLPVEPWRPSVWAFLLLLASLGQVVPVLLFMQGLPRTGRRVGTILASLELPVSVVAAAYLLGTAVAPIQWTGIALILGGVALSQWAGRPIA